MSNGKRFIFSTVIPVYNVEQYLEETVESVIAQSIGFEENIQMILVNDGSPDASEKICLKYQQKYPNNIIYVKQENAGVSAARNNGARYATGQYLNFLDSDDKWSPDAYQEVYNFWQAHPQVSVVTCKQRFFEAADNLHILSRGEKFKEDRVIDITKDYKMLHMNVTSTFIEREAALVHQFDEKLSFGEDAIYINDIILETGMYGVVSHPTHFYRKRLAGGSAVQGQMKNPDYFLGTPEKLCQKLIQISQLHYGRVLPYVQNLLAYEYRWRVSEPLPEILSDTEQKAYFDQMQELLESIDDRVITGAKYNTLAHKWYILGKKNHRDLCREYKTWQQSIVWNNMEICNLEKAKYLDVDIMESYGNYFEIVGTIHLPIAQELFFYAEDEKGDRYPIQLQLSKIRKDVFWGEEYYNYYEFVLKLPLDCGKKYCIKGLTKQNAEFTVRPSFKKYAKLSYVNLDYRYTVMDKFILSYRDNVFELEQNNSLRLRRAEKEYRAALLKYSEPEGKSEKREEIEQGIKLRNEYFRLRRWKRKPIWLISDRSTVAGDNGEAFFRYMVQSCPKDIEFYFVINEDTREYEKLRQIGPVLAFGSKKHLLYTLLAERIISSQGEEYIVNPFGNRRYIYTDLMRADFVFLQHGITKDDLSKWLCRRNKNLKLFVTAAKEEYKSIVNGDYGYTSDVVKLTGFARYDNLLDGSEPKKKIVIMPTWRKSLRVAAVEDNQGNLYNPEFVESDYFRFYNGLINDERLLRVMRDKGYEGKLVLHIHCRANAGDFTENDVFQVQADNVDYAGEFRENMLLVTDFSSVKYDFAYMHKPVIYTQFDKDSFFEGQVYDKGYWDYETMGFGPVCYDYESAVNTIIEYLENDCKLEDMYRRRIDDFYAYHDRNNCERIYRAIRQIDEIFKSQEEICPDNEMPTLQQSFGDGEQKLSQLTHWLKDRNTMDVDEQEMDDLVEMLENMDDFLIAQATNRASCKIFLFQMKYGQQFSEGLYEVGGVFYFRNIKIFNLCNKNCMNGSVYQMLEQKKSNSDSIQIVGNLYYMLPMERSQVVVEVGGEEYEIKHVQATEKNEKVLGKVMRQEFLTKCDLPLSLAGCIGKVCYKYDGKYRVPLGDIQIRSV